VSVTLATGIASGSATSATRVTDAAAALRNQAALFHPSRRCPPLCRNASATSVTCATGSVAAAA